MHTETIPALWKTLGIPVHQPFHTLFHLERLSVVLSLIDPGFSLPSKTMFLSQEISSLFNFSSARP